MTNQFYTSTRTRIAKAWALAIFAVLAFSSLIARADEIVADCTEEALRSAIADAISFAIDDGTFEAIVTFEEDCDITLSAPIILSAITTDFEETAMSGKLSLIIQALDEVKVSISAGGSNRVFEVGPNVSLTLAGLTITGGNSDRGAAMFIRSGATNILTNCTFIANQAVGSNGLAGDIGSDREKGKGGNGKNGTAGQPARGGAIFNQGVLTIFNCTFATNTAAGGDGGDGGDGGNGLFIGGRGGKGAAGAGAWGGAIHNSGSLLISNSTFSANLVIGGGGGAGGAAGAGMVGNLPGSGSAGGPAYGAAIYSTKPFIIASSAFYDNSATGGDSADGGGMLPNGNGVSGAKGGDSFGGAINATGGSVENSTFFNNVATGGIGGTGGNGTARPGRGGSGGAAWGGGLYNTKGTIKIINCTFINGGAVGGTNGVAGSGVSPGIDGRRGQSRGGNLANASGKFTLLNSIVATNSGGGDAYGKIIDGSNNITSDQSITLSSRSNSRRADPRLAPLDDNGGPTKTMALLPTSPAIDRVPPIASSLETDQRGFPRFINSRGDSGAYEFEGAGSPAILEQPQPQTVLAGSLVTFTVRASGAAPLSYVWRFNGKNIPNERDTSFTLLSATATNAGQYDVVVSNSAGAITSSVANLTVHSRPTITLQPTNQTVPQGGTVSFFAFASGDSPLSFQWRFNETNIPGAINPSYTVTNAQTNHAGSYKVIISNPYGNATSAVAVLSLGVPPSISAQPVNQFVGLSNSANFSVIANGTAPINYQWRFNGTNIPNAIAPFYSLNPVLTNNAGLYDVLVSNPYGSAVSQPASLTVGPLGFSVSGRLLVGTDPLPNVTVTAGTNSTLSDSNGYYAIFGLTNSVYTITPALGCFQFSPPSRDVILGPSAPGVDFSAIQKAFTITGRLTNGAGLTVTAGAANAVADTNGNYVLTNVCAGAVTVVPLGCYQFVPPSVSLDLSTNQSEINFSVTNIGVLSLGGTITNGAGPVTNVVLQISGAGTNYLVTNAINGRYQLASLCPGVYTVTPTQTCQAFVPASRNLTLASNSNNLDFFAYGNDLFNIRGKIVSGPNSVAVPGVTVTAGDRSTTTDSSGNFAFSHVCPGFYKVTAVLSNYCFSPQSVSATVTSGDVNDVNFNATLGVSSIRGTISGLPSSLNISVTAIGEGRTNSVFSTNGVFAFSNMCPGTYSITPSLDCYQFYPGPPRSVVVPPDYEGLNFAAFPVSFNLQGTVFEGPTGLQGVSLTAAGQTTLSDVHGNYSLANLCGDYAITPSLSGYVFQPPVLSGRSAGDTRGLNFQAFPVLNIGQLTNGFLLSALATPGRTYRLEVSTNLVQWQGVFTNFNNPQTNTVFLDTATNLGVRFYRLAQ